MIDPSVTYDETADEPVVNWQGGNVATIDGVLCRDGMLDIQVRRSGNMDPSNAEVARALLIAAQVVMDAVPWPS